MELRVRAAALAAAFAILAALAACAAPNGAATATSDATNAFAAPNALRAPEIKDLAGLQPADVVSILGQPICGVTSRPSSGNIAPPIAC